MNNRRSMLEFYSSSSHFSCTPVGHYGNSLRSRSIESIWGFESCRIKWVFIIFLHRWWGYVTQMKISEKEKPKITFHKEYFCVDVNSRSNPARSHMQISLRCLLFRWIHSENRWFASLFRNEKQFPRKSWDSRWEICIIQIHSSAT